MSSFRVIAFQSKISLFKMCKNMCEKTTKCKEKVWVECAKTAISGIFGRKTTFLENRTRSCFKHSYYTSLCKKSEKTRWNLEKMPKNVFSGIFPAFSAGKICLSKIGHGHILDIAILHQCAKFHEKIESTAREIQEILFFRQKSAAPVIFRKFRLQKSV